MNTENEEPKKEKIKISGTYGDKVKLHLNGYVYTKYNEMFKIKSVEQEKRFIYLYGCGEGGYDYSRIAGSCKVSEDSNNEYLNYIKYMFEILKLKEDSIVKYRFNNETTIETVKLVKITYPTLLENDYVPKITLERLEEYELIELSLDDFDEFKQNNLVSVEFTPYTFEEKLEILLDDMCDFRGAIKSKKEYLKKLLELIQTDFKS